MRADSAAEGWPVVTNRRLLGTKLASWATIGAKTGTNGGFGVTAHIEHFSEVLKILDGALKANASMAANYAGLLADKLERDGQRQQARLVRGRRHQRLLAHLFGGGVDLDEGELFAVAEVRAEATGREGNGDFHDA